MKATWELERMSTCLVFPWEDENQGTAKTIKEARKELARRRDQDRRDARRFKAQLRYV